MGETRGERQCLNEEKGTACKGAARGPQGTLPCHAQRPHRSRKKGAAVRAARVGKRVARRTGAVLRLDERGRPGI